VVGNTVFVCENGEKGELIEPRANTFTYKCKKTYPELTGVNVESTVFVCENEGKVRAD
jgi:hypothetical protein